MLRAVLRDLLAHRARTAMTLAAIAAGVAFVVASFTVAESTAQTLAGGDTRKDVAAAVYGTGGPALTPADVRRLAAIDGAATASGVVTGRSGLLGPDGELVGERLDHGGSNWDATGRYTLTGGRAPCDGDDVALRAPQARQAGLSVGDRARLLLPGGRSEAFTVVGIFDYTALGPRTAGGAASTEPEPVPVAAYAPATARALFGGSYDRIELTARSGVDWDALAAAAERRLGPGGHRVTTGAELAGEAERAARKTAADTRDQLLPFAAAALLAGGFVIANTFAALSAQRMRRFALLRAVGARRGQVRRTALAEAALIGLAGSTLGALLGAAGGLAASALTDPGGPGAQETAYAVPPVGVAAGYLAGVTTAVLAACVPARRAAAAAPTAALRSAVAAAPAGSRARTALGAAAILLGAVAIAATARPGVDALQRIIGIGGAGLAVAGVLLLTPAMVAAALRPLSTATRRRGGVAGRLAVRNAARDPRRTAATASALMVGLTLIGVFATLSASLASLATSSIRATVPETTTVVRPAVSDSSLDPADVARISSLPQAGAAVAARDAFARIEYGSGRARRIVTAVDAGGFGDVLRPDMVAGTADLARGALVSRNQADMLGLGPGDAVALDLGSGVRVDTVVAGTYAGTEMQASLYFDAAELPERAQPDITAVYATGPDPRAAREAIGAVFDARPDVAVTGRQGLIEDRLADFRTALAVVYAMFGFASAIGAFGVVNALTLAVLERVHEIGVLRAVGASRRLIGRAIRLESLFLAAFGGVLGTAAGVGAGTVVQHSLLGQRLTDATVPLPLVAGALAATAVVGVLTAVWPVRRALRIPVVEALADG